MFTKLLKIIGLMLLGLTCFMLWAPVSSAVDTSRITGYTEIYGDINVEVKATGAWFKDTTVMEQEFIQYHRLGVSSYIWDPRLVLFDVTGNFYQNYMRGDIVTHNYILYGGSGVATFFPRSFLPVSISGSREQSIDGFTVTHGGGNVDFVKRGWPGIYLAGSWVNYQSDEQDFRQDKVYIYGSGRIVYEILFKPRRLGGKENGRNGNGRNGKNGRNGEEVPTASKLLITASYDFRRIEDRLTDIFTDEHRGDLFLGYFFNNNRTFILNNIVWNRLGNYDSYIDNLNFFHQWSPTFRYSLGGFYGYNTSFYIDRLTNNDTQSAGAFINCTKLFSPQWRLELGAEGNFSSNSQKETSWGASGYGGIFSRIFPDFDWGATVTGGVQNNEEHKTTSNYGVRLEGIYRITPTIILNGDGNFTYFSGLSNTHGYEGRGRLTLDAIWTPEFTLRGIAEYRYRDFSQLQMALRGNETVDGRVQTGTIDIYGAYRFTSRTSLYGGFNFTYNNYQNIDSITDKFVRAYATLSSNPWDNFNYSITTEYDYAIDGKRWVARVRPQAFYVWRQIYFTLLAEFNYLSEANHNTNNSWNYYVNFKISRPFSIRWF